MYHSFSDLLNLISREELCQLVDDENAGSIVESPPNAAMIRVTAAGNKAQGIIDGYCRGRYTLPLSPVPDMIKDLSVELTVYNCMARKKEIALSEEQNRRYKNAVNILEHIQQGKIKLFDDIIEPPAFVSNKTAEDRTFDEETLDQF
jgi:phage gp36-like protein